MISHAASVAGCDELVSEDLNAGEVINGVKIINPSLDLRNWLATAIGSAMAQR